MRNVMGNERGIVADWLAKVVIGIAIFGVILFDAGSILVNFFTLDSASDDVALAVSLVVDQSDASQFTDEEIFREAEAIVNSESEGIEGARVLRRGTGLDDEGNVTIRLRRVASTLVVSRIGAIESWARATANGRAGTT